MLRKTGTKEQRKDYSLMSPRMLMSTSFFFSKTNTLTSCDHSKSQENLGHVIQPLIDGIRMYTKASVTILVGSPPREEGGSYFVKVMNAGKTTDTPVLKNFHDWDEQVFKTNIVQHFERFLSHTHGMLFLT